MMNIIKYLNTIYDKCEDNVFFLEKSKHNLNLNKNNEFLKILDKDNCKTAIKLFMPHLEEMIFSAKREAALELLDQNKHGVCIDYFSTWGTLSIGMAKRGHQVISVDKTYESLKFLKDRSREEGLDNIYLVHDDEEEVKFKNIADFFLLNDALETISKKYKNSRKIQISFLNKIYESLNQNGQLLLGIENKLSYRNFFGNSNPHTYSFNELESLIKEAGFSQIEEYCCFPSYHFPSLIVPNSKDGIKEYEIYEDKNNITWKQKLMFKYFEIFLMKYMKAKNFCPAIIIIAKK